MKNKLAAFLFMLIFFIPAGETIAQNHPSNKIYATRNIILKMAKVRSSSLRSAGPSVIASLDTNIPSLSIDFEFEGQFEIIISNSESELYNNTISIYLLPNSSNNKLTIPTSSFKQGEYTLTIRNLSNQDTSSGKFMIIR